MILEKIARGYEGFKNALMNPQQKQAPDINDKEVITKIVSTFKDRSRKDIQKWRNGIAMAEDHENPSRYYLADLYDDLCTDSHLHAAMQLRRMASLGAKFNVVDIASGNTDNELTALFKTQWFHEYMSVCIDSVFRGIQVPEFSKFDGLKVGMNQVPDRNILPTINKIVFSVSGEEGIIYDQPYYEDWLFEVGKPNDLGVLNKVIPQLIWKKNSFQAWAEFAEKFGIPMVIAKTTKTDKKSLDRIESVINQLGEASTGVFPEGTTIEIKELSNDDSYNVYDKLIARSNSEISKAILGGDMILDNGSSRSQSEVHLNNFNRIVESDKALIEFTTNNKLVPLLRKHGYAFTDNHQFEFDRTKEISIEKHWTIVNEALQHFEIPVEWVSKTFHFPIEGKKEERPVNFNEAPAAKAGAVTNFPVDYNKGLCSCAKHTPIIMAAANTSKILGKIQEELNENLYNKKDVTKQQAKKAAHVGKMFREGLFNAWGKRRQDIDYNATDHKALAFMEYNLFHFANTREIASVFKLNKLLIDPETKKLREYKDFKKAAEPFLEQVNKNWLNTEYNLAVATGQNAASYHRHLSEVDMIADWIYRTIGDSNVRPPHELLNGKIFSFHDKAARRLIPPNGYGCRCEEEQYTGTARGKRMNGNDAIGIIFKDQDEVDKWAVNRGDIGQVFLQNQFYLSKSKTEQNLNKFYNSLDYATFDLDKWVAGTSKYKKLVLDNSINAGNVNELFKPVKGEDYMGFRDYLKRGIILKKKDFEKHTKGKYLNMNRHKLFPHVKDILGNPDEVYLSIEKSTGKEQMRYVKLFDDDMIIVNVKFEGNNQCIKTWYSAKGKNNPNEERNGLYIK